MEEKTLPLIREEITSDGRHIMVRANMPIGQKFTGYEGVQYYLKRGWRQPASANLPPHDWTPEQLKNKAEAEKLKAEIAAKKAAPPAPKVEETK